MKSNIILGIGIGICFLSYYNAYGYILISFILFILTNILNKVKIKDFFKKGLVIAGISFIIAGWWFIRSAIIYNGDFLGLKTQDEYANKYAMPDFKPAIKETPQRNGESLLYMFFNNEWLKSTYLSFIAIFGGMEILLPYMFIYKIYFIIHIMGFIGQLLFIKKNFTFIDKNEEEKTKVILNYSFIFSIIIPIILSVYYSYTSDFQPQGRYIMPMVIPFYYFVITGIKNIVEKLEKRLTIKNTEKIKKIITLSFMFVMLTICMYSLFMVNIPYYHQNV